MIDGYLFFEVFELENGWLLKVTYPDNPKAFNPVSYRSYYHSSIKSLCCQLEACIKEKEKKGVE